MRLSQRVILVCAILMMPVSSAFAQLRLSGNGTLDEVQSPFTAFSVGAVQFEFLLPQPPNGEALPPAAFLLVGITGRFSQGSTQLPLLGDLLFYTSEFDGGFVFESPAGFALLNTTGAQLFTRSVNNPVFRTGRFAITDLPGAAGVIAVNGNVVISAVSTVPEPASAGLAITGALLLMACRRCRPTVARAGV